MSDLFAVTTDEMLSEAMREVAVRQGAYPRWVASGKITQPLADKRLRAMQGIVDKLKEIKSLHESRG